MTQFGNQGWLLREECTTTVPRPHVFLLWQPTERTMAIHSWSVVCRCSMLLPLQLEECEKELNQVHGWIQRMHSNRRDTVCSAWPLHGLWCREEAHPAHFSRTQAQSLAKHLRAVEGALAPISAP